MSLLPNLLAKLPIFIGVRLAWRRSVLDRTYSKQIMAARRINDIEKVENLIHEHRSVMQLHEEEEDENLTKALLAKARRLRIPIPQRSAKTQEDFEYWYEGQCTGQWYLTPKGISFLREEIRREVKARHESRAQWVVWLSALTGVIGTITGLVALILHK